MATKCRQDSFDFGTVEGRAVVGAFDGGVISSDAGALLLGATDKAVRLVERFAACFHDGRNAGLIEHRLATLVGQRLFAIALGHEDLNDHDASCRRHAFGMMGRGAHASSVRDDRELPHAAHAAMWCAACNPT
jgi:hypothetical protein